MVKSREILFSLVIILGSLLIVIGLLNDSVLAERDVRLYELKKFLFNLLGWKFFVLPLLLLLGAMYLIGDRSKNFGLYLINILLLFLGIVLLFPDPLSVVGKFGLLLNSFLGSILSFFIGLSLIVTSIIYFFDIPLVDLLENKIPSLINFIFKFSFEFTKKVIVFVLDLLDFLGGKLVRYIIGSKNSKINEKNTRISRIEQNPQNAKKTINQVNSSEVKNEQTQVKKRISFDFELSQDDLQKNSIAQVDGYYIPSPFFLQSFVSKIYPRLKGNTTKDYSEILEETLKNFGIASKVIDVQIGPSITRYELQIEKGVKVSQILRLKNDIALALAAIAVRIEAPIPGKSAIGIEVPNDKPVPVYLSDILTGEEFINSTYEIPLAIGKDTSGNVVLCDLTKTPHLLIAGSTGSGKTVCINSIICSMLFKFPPTKLQLLLIDPKMVELILYEGIPHVIDIVTDVKKAPNALLSMVKTMEDRYKLFSTKKVRNIQEYNSLQDVDKLPYIVIVIDELADLMMTSSNAVESHIARLTQLARAAGIHLIIATQRPSANVITGVIKANIPSRIAFAVASQVDSRVILDIAGAENLIGRGDMLYMPIGSTRPIRAQGCFVGLKEIELIVKYWQLQPKPDNLTPINLEVTTDISFESTEEDPELLKQAAKIILEDKKASTTLLQRKLRVGFAKAGRIMDILEKMNIVGPQEGSKPRKILIQNFEEIEKIFRKQS
ncbi:MAG: DNA translocase FtsK [bacterium]